VRQVTDDFGGLVLLLVTLLCLIAIIDIG
jgi:hypothetical protein